MQYKFAHVLRVPIKGRYTFSFGKTMHATLQRFFEEARRRNEHQQTDIFGNVIGGGSAERVVLPSLDELLKMFDACWIDEWYQSAAQKKDYRDRGVEALKKFYKEAGANPPRVLHLEATEDDYDHVVAVFKQDGCWGAVSKTHHSVLRFRDPVYKSIRELAMSYFHEYFLDNGQKTLRKFSKHPLDFRAFADDWLVADYPLWGVHDTLITARHERVASASVLKHLRRADPIEITAGKLVQKKR